VNHGALGHILRETGRFDEAAEAYGEALAIWKKLVAEFDKDDYRNHFSGMLVNLAVMLQSQGKLAKISSVYSELGEHGRALDLNNLAWWLATDPEPNLRDGTNAVVFGEKAVAATNRKNVSYLDTLAAAYAEA